MSSPLKEKKNKKKPMMSEESILVEDEMPVKKKKKSKEVIKEENNIGYYDQDYEMKDVPVKPPMPSKRDEREDNWAKEDYKELIRRMEEQIPKNDTKSFSSRVEKLDWTQIQFGSHSAEECFEKWKVLKSKVRHYRLLEEILQDSKVWVENPWATSTNNKKKNRHPDQPTRPLSSFMLYYMKKKEKIIKRNPNVKLTDISRIIGDKYKALPEEKRAYYLQKSARLQEDYKQNLKLFYEKHPELAPVSKRPQQSVNSKPQTPFKLYYNQKLCKHQNDIGFNKNDFLEKCKLAWKNLSLKKKASWVRLAKQEEDKYLKQLEDLSEENKPTTHKSVISKDENALLDRLAGKPEKPPNSAYSLFSKRMLQEKGEHVVEGEPKSRMREVANKWKVLPEEKKRWYQEELKLMVEKYKLEFANYLDSLPEDKKAEELAKLQPKKKVKKIKPNAVKQIYNKEENLFKNEPPKPPVTAWDLFKNEFVKKNSSLTSKEAFRQAAGLWKNLSSKETEKYKRKHEQLKAEYMQDFEAFLKSLSEAELTEYSALKTQVNAESEESAEDSSDEDDDSSTGSGSVSSEQSDSGVSEDEG